MIKLVTIIGARPQFIKAACVSRAIAQKNEILDKPDRIVETIIHTGQHYDSNMSSIFFNELNIPEPNYNLNIGSGRHGEQTGRMLLEIEKILIDENPDIVLTYGDTNSTMAGAVAASKLTIPTAHVEAGLRSFNKKMPEEINRIVTDKLSTLLFCPTQTAVDNLISEGIAFHRELKKDLDIDQPESYLVGDVMNDSVLYNAELACKKTKILSQLQLSPKQYILATVHRAENTDEPQNLFNIFAAFNEIAATGTKIVVPLHPRTKKYLTDLQGTNKGNTLSFHKGIKMTEPVSYLNMISLEQNARAVFTDSGGVQKEAYLLNIPCVTLRTETEWVETIKTGWNIICGPDSNKIKDAWEILKTFDGTGSPFLKTGPEYSEPQEISGFYGDGHASEKIIEIIFNKFMG